MCGLTAFLALNEVDTDQSISASSQALASQINDSLDLVKHRGPDARGQWISLDTRVGLGHVRLSIIDLSPAGNQPFHDKDNHIQAVVNGELYDYERIRNELADEYEFVSKSDSEIVIALYRRYGLSFLSRLRGEFALVLWDVKQERFIAARDRYGIKSLYYTVINGRLHVATEMKSFLPFGWTPEWDVANLRGMGWVYGANMFFKHVHRIEPGQMLVSDHFQPAQLTTYWDLDYPDKKLAYPGTEAEVIARVRELLLESVRLRLRADVGVGVFLSGGLDSSAVAGMTAHLMRQGTNLGNETTSDTSKLSCFTVQFEKDSGIDESEIARRTAEWLGVDFHAVLLDEETIASRLEDTIWYTETPFPDVDGMGRLAIAEAARAAGKKVVLTGEGSDEHFAGYADLMWSYLSEPDHSWPASSAIHEKREEIETAINRVMAQAVSRVRVTSKSDAVHSPSHASLFARIAWFGRLPFQSWTEQNTHGDPESSFFQSFGRKIVDNMEQRWHPLNSSQYQFTKSVLANCILRYIGDNIDMVYQIETRPPFLDHHLTEYVNTIPPSLKIRYDPERRIFREKHVLREAMRPFITHEVANRVKQPYLAPTRYKENGPVYHTLRRLLTKSNIQNLGFIDWNQVQETFKRAFSDDDPSAFRSTLSVAQLVVLAQRFGVKPASPVWSVVESPFDDM
ncbi:asparagine synthetase B family protein [Aspergillus homomorphus CBS 101889]|uniref:Asparagine synthetase n=1 Tax=Aspergillus homomorphus (strain CBS 101889) TaxID=1450537 RepID=A0A395I858_ASPHC|nr:asparagine synthetase [Aspergillus homomorphus CBS 101889]RAL16135.1 asparagine synthetase [Aspergillus homomorphus CBS 101889]